MALAPRRGDGDRRRRRRSHRGRRRPADGSGGELHARLERPAAHHRLRHRRPAGGGRAEGPGPRMSAATPDAVARAFVAACEAELAAPKPGNVHHFAPGHGMEARDFIESARAAAPHIAAPGAQRRRAHPRRGRGDMGRRRPEHQSRHRPALRAAGPCGDRRRKATDLAQETARVLAELDRRRRRTPPFAPSCGPIRRVSARRRSTTSPARRKRRCSKPCGRRADRDRIGCQYAHGFVDIFETGLDALASRPAAQGHDAARATLEVYHGLSLPPSPTAMSPANTDLTLRKGAAGGGPAPGAEIGVRDRVTKLSRWRWHSTASSRKDASIPARART